MEEHRSGGAGGTSTPLLQARLWRSVLEALGEPALVGALDRVSAVRSQAGGTAGGGMTAPLPTAQDGEGQGAPPSLEWPGEGGDPPSASMTGEIPTQDASEGGAEAWARRILSEGAALGLVGARIRRSPRELGFDQGGARVLVAALRTDGGEPGWIVFEGGRPRRLRVQIHRPEGVTRLRVSPGELAECLGLGGPKEAVPWVALEPGRSLECLASPEGQPPTPFRRLMALVRTERSSLFGVVVFAVMSGILALATPVAVQGLVGTLAFGMVLQPLIVLGILLFAALSFAGLTQLLEIYVVERLQRRLFVRTAVDFAHRIPRVRFGAWGERRGPELMNRFFEVVTLQKAASTLLMSGLATALQTVIGLLLLGFYHPLLLAFDLLLLLSLGGIVLLGRGATYTALKESSAKYAVAAWLEELARAPLTFKDPAGEALALARADALAGDYLNRRIDHFRVVLRQHVGGLAIQILASVALLSLGGWLVIQGQLTLGQLVASELVVTAVVTNYAKLGKYFESFYDLLAGVEKLGVVVDLPMEAPQGRGSIPPGAVPLRLEALTLPGLAGSLTLAVGAGEQVALLGMEPRSRRALFDLLYALRPPPPGHLFLAGRELGHLQPASLRGRVALVRGDELIAGTLAENVSLGSPEISPEEVEEALRWVGILATVEALPLGLETPILPEGGPLTPSQGVRLNLARALARRPGLLLIDGALDRLSQRGQREILGALKALPWPMTVLFAGDGEALGDACGRALRVSDSGHLGEVEEGHDGDL